MTHRDELRVAKALQGADFPARPQVLVNYAETRGAEEKTLRALRAIPEDEYESVQHVVAAIPQEPEGEDRAGGVARQEETKRADWQPREG